MLRQEKITNAFVGAGFCLSHLLLKQFVSFKRDTGVFLFRICLHLISHQLNGVFYLPKIIITMYSNSFINHWLP